MTRKILLFAALAASGWGQNWSAVPAFSFDAQQSGRGDADYQSGLKELDAQQWDQAIASFSISAARGKANAGAALYWLAYAQDRAGLAQPALRTLAHLRERYPDSRWLKDARALELEIRAQTGSPVSPSSEPDDDLKLVAVNSLMTSNPAMALPVVEKVLLSGDSDRVKDQALFVLSQSSLPEAGKLLGDIAGGKSNPRLQIKAIHVMGMMGNDQARKSLNALYALSSDVRVKRAILQSYMQSGSRDLLLHAARTEFDAPLRREAIRQLALTGATDELWQLYRTDGSVQDKKAILESAYMSGDSNKLVEVARSDSSPELREAAINSLGLMGSNGHTETLISIYTNEKDLKLRESVLNALFLQQNGKALIELARREKDPEMKKAIVSKMALVPSKDVAAYLAEILK